MSKTAEKNGTATKEEIQSTIDQQIKAAAAVFIQELGLLCMEHNAELVATPRFTQDGRTVAAISHLYIHGRLLEIRQ